MPFSFTLPTTSHASLTNSLTSSTHPSLPLTATTYRGVFRQALKAHKRLPTASRAAHLSSTVQPALDGYIPLLLALDHGLSGRSVAGEEVDVAMQQDMTVEWRATLSKPAVPGRDPGRVKLPSFEFEVLFVLHTAALVQYLQARSHLRILYDAATTTMATPEQRASAVAAAMKCFLSAHGIWTYLSTRSSASSMNFPAVDISTPALQGLASLSLAEATLIAVFKDDPWPAAIAQARNKNDKEWMIKAPEIPRVRAHLFARLCQAAADHAGRARSLVSSAGGRINDDVVQYAEDLQRTARAKACRMLGIDREAEAKTGEAIAWLRGARRELGLSSSSAATADGDDDKKRSGFSKLKADWRERREDRRVEKGGEWGNDGGRLEENRVLVVLEEKWTRLNDTVNVQPVPPIEPLVASLPSGREYHQLKLWVPPLLEAGMLASLRAPPELDARIPGADEADSDDEAAGLAAAAASVDGPVGAFPGTAGQYAREGSGQYY